MNSKTHEITAAVEAVRDLLDAHFRDTEQSSDDDGRFSPGFRLSFDRSRDPTKVKVTCRVSKVTTDEIECRAGDPDQTELPL